MSVAVSVAYDMDIDIVFDIGFIASTSLLIMNLVPRGLRPTRPPRLGSINAFAQVRALALLWKELSFVALAPCFSDLVLELFPGLFVFVATKLPKMSSDLSKSWKNAPGRHAGVP